MTGNDLIMLVPWIIFGAGLTVIFLRLLRLRHPSRRPAALPEAGRPRAREDPGGSPGAVPRRPGQAAGCGQHGGSPS